MSLDRQSIERKDFPIGRRGYEPDAVDAHLAALADEVEELRRSSQRRPESLAASAGERVRAIVEAAEASAEAIQRAAEEEAREIRNEAKSEARLSRDEASTEVRGYVGKVSESASTMLERLEAMESEIGSLIEAIKTGGSRLSSDLQVLETNLGGLRESVGSAQGPSAPGTQSPSAPVAQNPSAPVAPLRPAPTAPEIHALDVEGEPDKIQGDALHAGEPMTGSRVAEATDDEGARLVALNMALNGMPREETEKYLSENFQLADQRSLLDEVYASVGS